jgi:hypothetical protein
MPIAKLLINKASGTLPSELCQLAGTAVSDHRDLGADWSVAELRVPIGRAGDAWEVAYEAVRETPDR